MGLDVKTCCVGEVSRPFWEPSMRIGRLGAFNK